MILSIQQLAGAVAMALEDEVLPILEARSWPASRIRSSLGLLQLIIDQAEHEQNAIVTGNRLIRTFLATIGDEDTAEHRDMPGADLTMLRAEGRRLRGKLSDVIRSSSAHRDDRSRTALHVLLRELDALDRPIHDEAIRFLPM